MIILSSPIPHTYMNALWVRGADLVFGRISLVTVLKGTLRGQSECLSVLVSLSVLDDRLAGTFNYDFLCNGCLYL